MDPLPLSVWNPGAFFEWSEWKRFESVHWWVSGQVAYIALQ